MPSIMPDAPDKADPYFSNEPEVLRSLITQARERAAKWQTKFYEAEASHTEARGMLCQERDAAITRLSEAKSLAWVSVEERVPENDELVVVWYQGVTNLGRWHGDAWWSPSLQITFVALSINVDYWMPLPEAPK